MQEEKLGYLHILAVSEWIKKRQRHHGGVNLELSRKATAAWNKQKKRVEERFENTRSR